MQHRHLIDGAHRSVPAIDDVIARGSWQDWVNLRRDCIDQVSLLDKVEQVCAANVHDSYAQRYHFWMNFVRQQRTAS